MTERLDVDAFLQDPSVRIVVCCGAGGVGKTTTAAALAVRAARDGRRVCVLTIDPARRLAQSLGLTHLDNIPRAVAGVEGPGSLDAMMLDMKRTFDEVVLAHADPARAQAILDNPFYQVLSSSFAGTQEYMAMEKLGQLRAQADQDGSWDLIVVDTPPSRSALDFLDAPARLSSFLDGRLIRVLSAPARGAGRGIGRLAAVGFGVFTSALGKILGAQILTDVSALVSALDSTFGGFRERATQTYVLLQDRGTRFVVVSTPEPDALREASYFVERLREDQMPIAGLVLNRVQSASAEELGAAQADAAATRVEPVDPVVAGLLRIHAQSAATAARQARVAERFTHAHPGVPLVSVRALAEDVHDLDGLAEVGGLLAAGAPPFPPASG